jgi:hypothetical protein
MAGGCGWIQRLVQLSSVELPAAAKLQRAKDQPHSRTNIRN